MRVTISLFSCLFLIALIAACADSGPMLQDPSYSDVQKPIGTGGAPGLAMDSMQQTGSTSLVAAGTGHTGTGATSSTGMMEGTGSTTGATSGGWSH